MFNQIDRITGSVGGVIWGWPMVGFVMLAGIIFTIAFRFIQFRAFGRGWYYVLHPEKKADGAAEEQISSLQAFINALSSSLGNGAIAGMATAIHAGGPGAAFWVFILGFFAMVIRFAEVYASLLFTSNVTLRGGPMVYLQLVPMGNVLSYVYAFFCLMLALFSGNAMQCNSIRLGIESLVGPYTTSIAIILFLFLLYIMFGGAHRIMRAAEGIIPIKVGLFFGSLACMLIYHYQAIIPALVLIVKSALAPGALAGGAIGFSMQQAIRFGFSRGLNAVEAGLGNAGILFGATGSKYPLRSAIMSMITAFVSVHLVSFLLMVVIVASDVWKQDVTSTALTIASFNTVFGYLGSWIVTFLSISFGLGVLVAYAYVGRECWLFLTNGRIGWVYTWIYPCMALVGALGSVAFVWNMIDIIVAGLMVINVSGLLFLIPRMLPGIKEYFKGQYEDTV